MLVLMRRVGEQIVIGDDIRVTVVAVEGGRVRLGFSAPDNLRVDRLEIREKRHESTRSHVRPNRKAVAYPADNALSR